MNDVHSGHRVHINYLDCKKVFDRVPHQRLLTKLEAIGNGEKIFGVDKKLS